MLEKVTPIKNYRIICWKNYWGSKKNPIEPHFLPHIMCIIRFCYEKIFFDWMEKTQSFDGIKLRENRKY